MKEKIAETYTRTSDDVVGKPSIACGYDHVVICSQYIPRPASISSKQWMEFWERVIAKELS